MLDWLIRGGLVVDGTGTPGRQMDLGIADGRIVSCGDLSGVDTIDHIEADGLVVAPGFIDLVSHSQWALLRDGAQTNKVEQGVTTEVVGEGLGVAPVEGDAHRLLTDELRQWRIPVSWSRLGEYERLVGDRGGMSTNVAFTVPGNQLRACVTDLESDAPLEDYQLDRMLGLARETFAAGAVGLGLVLEEPPGSAFTSRELELLLTLVAERAAVAMVHVRNEGAHVLEAVEEVISLAERSGARTEIIHLKATRASPSGSGPVIGAIEAARGRGVDISANTYPYTAAVQALQELVPEVWPRDPQRLATELRRGRRVQDAIARALHAAPDRPSWDQVWLATPPHCSVAALSRHWGVAPERAVVQLMASSTGWVTCNSELMEEGDVQRIVVQPWVSVATDGGAKIADTTEPLPAHPREFGTFPKLFARYVRDLHLLTLEEAVRKVSSRPARQLGLRDRGTISVGNWADLVVMDLDRVQDLGTFEHPDARPQGIEWVVVNGTVNLRPGGVTGERPGRFLRA